MYRIIILTLLLSFCHDHKNDPKKNYLAWLFAIQTTQTEQTAYNNAKTLIGPLGQFEWRGLTHPDKSYIPNTGKFNYNEAGDGTFHTGILLSALAWKYKNDLANQSDVKVQINKILSYYKLHQTYNGGGIGRDFVDNSAYILFPPCEQNGNVVSSVNQCGVMRYRKIQINGTDYWQRMDISIDAMLNTSMALYWTYKFVPDSRVDIKIIATAIYNYYIANNWILKDVNGNAMVFGDHTPSDAIPLNRINETILKYLMNESKQSLSGTALSVMNASATYVTGVYLSKSTRNQFNNYMILQGLHVMKDMGYVIDVGLNNIINENSGENNFLANAINNYWYKAGNLTIQNFSYPLLNYHCASYTSTDYAVDFSNRTGYNMWENSPYRLCLFKTAIELKGNEEVIQAWWLY